MARYSAIQRRFPAFYRHDILTWRRKQLGLSVAKVAQMSKQPEKNVQNAFLGKTKNHTVFPVCRALGIDWVQIHNLNLKRTEFHLAVLNGNGSKNPVRRSGEGGGLTG